MTDDYDAADNARKCYDVAIAAMREKLNGFRQERIGDCWLINADCREVLPLLPKVDAVVYNDLHEKSAIWKPKTGGRSGGDLGKSQADDCGPVCKRGLVATGIGDGIRLLPTGGCQGTPPHGDTFEITGAGRGSERQIHRRNAEHDLSNDDREDVLREVRNGQNACGSPQGPQSHEQRTGEFIGSLLSMSHQPPQARVLGAPKGWAVLTDPPYGIDIACKRIRDAYAQPDMFVEQSKTEPPRQLDLMEAAE